VPAAARGGVLTDSGTNPAAPGDAPPNDPAGRGWTSITDHVHGISRQRISRALRSGGGVEAHAAIDGGLAQLRVEIEVDYPAPVRQITRQVRRHVRDRVTRLCGLTVTDVDITVAALRLETLQVRRVL